MTSSPLCRLLGYLLLALGLAAALPRVAADLPGSDTAAATAPVAVAADIELFVREGCPHCARAEAFLAALGRERLELTIVIRDVGKDRAALDRLKELAQLRGARGVRVPALFVGDQLLVGFSRAARSDQWVLDALARRPVGPTAGDAGTCNAEESLACTAGPTGTPDPSFEITVFGRILSPDRVGLPLFTVAMGLLDGLNPCSMWVLILMISLLAPLNDRRRMLAIAGTFVLIQGLAYYAFMAAWLNLFLFIGLSRASEILLGAIAIVAGVINVKEFLAFGRGISLSIPDAAKPGIYARMRGILQAENMALALVGTVILGVLVQVVELVCTSGFPALFTRILTLRELGRASYYGYLLLYNAAYLLDDVIVLAIGVITLSHRRLQEKEGRALKLVSGLAMFGLGLYLVAGSGA